MRFPTIHLPSKLPDWISRIKESSTTGKWEEVLSHYQEMKNAGVHLTDPSVFPSILKACSNVSFICGKSMHACLVKQGFELFTSVSNSTMDLYGKCGDLGSAFGVFNCMRSRDSVSWNIMIRGFLVQGALQEGLQWFMNARVAGFEPSNSTVVLVIQACQSLRAKLEGMEVHGYVIKSGFFSIGSVQNSLLSMYAEADMESAWRMFDEMCDKDVISWSVIIGGYVRSGKAQVGLQVFQEMVSDVSIEPDAITMVSVLKACTSLGQFYMGRVVHGLVISRGFGFDLYVGNSLIDMYSKCYDADSAFKVFNEMSQRNNVSWNSILSGFVLNKKHLEALSLFYSMGKEGIEADEVTLVNILQTCKYFVQPFQCKSVHCVIVRRGYESNELVLNSLIDAYAKCDLVELAWDLFDGMERRDVVSWSTMIAGFTYCGNPDEAIAVFQEMSHDAQEKLNAVAIINLLDACSASAELRKSKWAHGISIRRGLEAEVAVGTAIVEMYSKCGAIEDSRKAFEQIPEKNVVSWSAMIAAYGMNGFAREALALLAEMKQHGVQPNAVTALSVLSACSHGGLVEEGLYFFNSMRQDCGVEPGLEHYSCVVDMLGRAGKLDCAMDLIKKLPDQGLEAAGASVWGALLSACRSHGNSELGAGAVSHVLEMEPLNSAGYLLASSMYASGGLWVDAARMRRLAKERGVRVVAGYSLVHVNNRACRFLAGERSHPQASEILDQLHSCMKIDKNLLVIEC
ncbi:pentatricopeptide repeat-containing protein At2g17210 [Alnus glutinosa]|uniref:pentatricopeptide repeat-containing protein At2g17210 n=1 Tax=Alnus glutinosa TaxID=3517 RepID=UPI002D79D0CB|nr:pentatricopeptide repeat-containing protein At2g17210 [Alnus glutinosa]